MLKRWILTATAAACLISAGWWQVPAHVLAAPAIESSEPNAPVNGPSHQFEIHSSVQVSREILREAYEASHDAYTKKLQKYAKCTEAQARKAVASEHPGCKIEDIQLRNIRTNLVYMAIARDDEDKYLVIVDAGNGNILLDRRIPTHHERVFADSPVPSRNE
ncbi:PepSY domain-containing protein [Alicyclobacillus mali (ex Roth et al. 2021)]|uniref:PepSY domain-containing protein n=1 Tax=Alicyclobacillus mali (ex Roth et al. 2021) TaxID=1123961 RepID=UPI000B0DD088|nr:hypothetical protein [Alicyclobacillus mali (ex Roth et al. 2021)]